MRIYEILCQVGPTRKYRSTQPVLPVDLISERRNTVNIGYMCTFKVYPSKKRNCNPLEEILGVKEEMGIILGV